MTRSSTTDGDPATIVVDSHVHVSDIWMEPVELLVFQMERNGVGKAVLNQISDQYDNTYQTRCLERYPDRFANVVRVDARAEDACDALTRLTEDSPVAGLRLSMGDQSPDPDPLAIWRRASELRLPVSLHLSLRLTSGESGLKGRLLTELAEVITELPDLVVVLEHQGGWEVDADDTGRGERDQAFGLSRFPNVFMKVGGVGEVVGRSKPLAAGPYAQPIPPIYEKAYEAFGAERLMWGSDYPPVSRRDGYSGALNSCRGRYASLSSDERSEIFGGTASRVFFPDSA